MAESIRNLKKLLQWLFFFALGGGVVYFLCRSFSVSWQQLSTQLSDISWGLGLLAALMYAAAFVVSGWNWLIVQYKDSPQLSRYRYLNIFIVSAFARYLPGGIWNIVGKAAWCIKAGADAEITAGAIIMEYLFQIASALLFLLFFLPILFEFSTALGIVLIGGAVIGVLFLPFWINVGFKLLSKIFRRPARCCYKPSFLYALLGRYMFAWILTGGSVLLLSIALSGEKIFIDWNLFFAYPPSWVAGFLSPSPNGLGVREWALKLLSDERLPQTTLALLLLGQRLCTICGEILALIMVKIYGIWKHKTANED